MINGPNFPSGCKRHYCQTTLPCGLATIGTMQLQLESRPFSLLDAGTVRNSLAFVYVSSQSQGLEVLGCTNI